MNTPSNTIPDSSLGTPATRPFYWSVRRELWENRSIYIAPLAVAALFLLAFLISLIHLPGKMRAASTLTPMQLHGIVQQPYNIAALMLMAAYLFVALFYCLDALYGERRDRSILFWKSLPVSDLTVVLSKASIPLLVLPLLTFAITLVTQLIMLILSSMVLVASGQSVSTLWNHLPFFQMSVMLLYHLLAMHGLYYAPFYSWFLLVSCWARRAPLLWAGLPILAIGVVERIAFSTSHFGAMLLSRFSGGPEAIVYPAGVADSVHGMTLLTLGKFLLTPGLWLGLIFATGCLFAAARIRRNREPI
jgi:ABC-2 type transport system permease protein